MEDLALRTLQAGNPGPSHRVLWQARHVRSQGTFHTHSLYSRAVLSFLVKTHDWHVSFHNQGKAKRNAWQKLVDEGVSPSDAQKKYVALVESLKKKHGYTG